MVGVGTRARRCCRVNSDQSNISMMDCQVHAWQQGLPVQFVVKTTRSFDRLNAVAQQLVQQAVSSGKFIFPDSTWIHDAGSPSR